MTASFQLKGLLAGIATVALIGTAMAQGNPPNPAVKNAPTGAGQQSSQQTPMGTTGTPAGGATAAGSTSSGGTGSSTTGSASSGGSTSGGSTMGSGSTDTTTAAAGTGGSRSVRRARADRN
ncbi:MAG: hypothetical protein JWQ13_3849 [Ramlibacter sp.]|jgi:hypothetical protein|nr:hypothetical protein [Ramlibacter sp.]